MNALAISSVFWLSSLGFFGPVGVVSVPIESTAQVGTLGLELEDSRLGIGTLELDLEDSQRSSRDRISRDAVGTLALELEDSAPGVGSLFLKLEDSPDQVTTRRSKTRVRKRHRVRSRSPGAAAGSLHLQLE